ncbi:MAG: GYF domain-containing protein, partial [Verrucomicrobiota bacterium]
MSAQELYLRPANATEARGPFPPEQLADLARAGEVTPETLVYDTTREGWVALAAAPTAPTPEAPATETPSAAPAAPPVPEITEILAESTRTGEAEAARLVRGATLGRRGALA